MVHIALDNEVNWKHNSRETQIQETLMSDAAKEICIPDPLDLEGFEPLLSDESQKSLVESSSENEETTTRLT